MKKKALIILLSLALTGCGSTNHVELTNPTTEPVSTSEETTSIETEASVESEPTSVIDDSEKVEVILRIVNFEDSSAEEYVAGLQADNPDDTYSVYNDDYYSTTITEKDRKEALKSFKDDSLLNDTFNEMYTNESMGGALISMDYDDDFQHFTFYVDKAKYEANELFCSIGIGLTVTALSDTYQAYNFIPPEDRITDIQIVDNETGEVLDDSSAQDDSQEDTSSDSIPDKLSEINNWYIGDIWNNFVNFDSYRLNGKDCTGSDIDIDYAYEQFEKAYAKKEQYDSYINALSDDEYSDLKKAWDKMNEQIELIYNDLQENGIKEGSPRFSLDLLRQYSDAFYSYIN